jgi:serpin B
LLLLLLAAGGCAGVGTTTGLLTPESPRAAADKTSAPAAADKTGAGAGAAAADAAAAKRVAAATTHFGMRLLEELAGAAPGKNVFVSPASIAFALAMTCNGAGGETQQAIARALALSGLSLSEVNQESAALLRVLQQPDPQVQLTVANALWADQGTTLRPDFVQRAEQSFHAEAATLNFSDPSALDTIHGWVRRKTNEKITTLLNEGA